MSTQAGNDFSQLIKDKRDALLASWLDEIGRQSVQMSPSMLNNTRIACEQLLLQIGDALDHDRSHDIDGRHWDEVRHTLAEISQERVRQGATPSETATVVFSLKQVLFAQLRAALAGQPEALADATWSISLLIDKLGLFTMELYQKSRDQIIMQQQQELLELSTPVVKLWEGILALPLIGTLDSARTQVVMESLLQKIVETGASIAVIDITGVPTVDTLVAQHLLKTVAAARLMGAECIISGIRPQIAQTIVHLGVNLDEVVTKATLADAFIVALGRTDHVISHQGVRV